MIFLINYVRNLKNLGANLDLDLDSKIQLGCQIVKFGVILTKINIWQKNFSLKIKKWEFDIKGFGITCIIVEEISF